MISNIDIQRRKTGIDKNLKRKQFVSGSIQSLYNHEHKLVTSKRFSKFMERLVRAYAEGEVYYPVPLFHKKHFPELVVSKFNSYDFEHKLVYDYLQGIFIFT